MTNGIEFAVIMNSFQDQRELWVAIQTLAIILNMADGQKVKKRKLRGAEKALDVALESCKRLLEEEKPSMKLTVRESLIDPITGRGKSRYKYRPRFSTSNVTQDASTRHSTADVQFGELNIFVFVHNKFTYKPGREL